MKRYGEIDLVGNQLVDVLFENQASAPGVATGRVYFDTTDAVVKVHDGSNWVDLSSPDDDFFVNLPNEISPDGNDSILIYDDSALVYKRQTRDNFFSNITGYLPAPVSPAGSNTYVQWNDNGDFGASENLRWTASDYLLMLNSNADSFSETTQVSEFGLVLINPDITAVSNKYAAIGLQAGYDVSHNSIGMIVLSVPDDSSNNARLNFQLINGSSSWLTPLYIDADDGVVSNSKLYAQAELDIIDYARIYRTTAGDAFHLRGDYTDIVFRYDGSVSWDIYTELGGGGNNLMSLGANHIYLNAGSIWFYGSSIRMGNIGSGGGTSDLRWDSLYGQVTYQTSDIRTKTKIREFNTDAVSVLRSFSPKRFRFKTEFQKNRVGWIAQEGVKYIPDMFPVIEKTGMYALDSGEILPYFHLAIVQVDDRVTQLEKEVVELKQKLSDAKVR